MSQQNDFTEILCPHCRQRVPVNREGKIARHYGTFKKQPNRMLGERGGKVKALCIGSEKMAVRE